MSGSNGLRFKMIWLSSDLRFTWFWLSIDLRFSNDFGCQLMCDSNDFGFSWFEIQVSWLSVDLKFKWFGCQLVWNSSESEISFSARFPSKKTLWSSTTKLFCETSFKNEALKIKNEAFLRDFLKKGHVVDFRIPIRFGDFHVDASKVLCLAGAYELL